MDIEAVTVDRWYPVATVDDLKNGDVHVTQVLGRRIEYGRTREGQFSARLAEGTGSPCRSQTRFHTHWISLGTPPDGLFTIPEFEEPDRRILGAGSMGAAASGLRAIENFLDMAHFPYVHTGILGDEPTTEVRPYRVEFDAVADEILGLGCVFHQPMAAATARGGTEVGYTYRVTAPFVAILYKTCPSDPARRDVICLFVQPCEEDRCIAHVVLAYIDLVTSDGGLRLFQQRIFGQDLMILANHVPKTLPLSSAMETPGPADRLSVAYRRWLRAKGAVYGAHLALDGAPAHG